MEQQDVRARLASIYASLVFFGGAEKRIVVIGEAYDGSGRALGLLAIGSLGAHAMKKLAVLWQRPGYATTDSCGSRGRAATPSFDTGSRATTSRTTANVKLFVYRARTTDPSTKTSRCTREMLD